MDINYGTTSVSPARWKTCVFSVIVDGTMTVQAKGFIQTVSLTEMEHLAEGIVFAVSKMELLPWQDFGQIMTQIAKLIRDPY